MVVPSWQAAGSTASKTPPLMATLVPILSPRSLVMSSTLETAAMLARASPRKPRLSMCSRSEASEILEVAYLEKQSLASSSPMPFPSSVTLMYSLPPFLISTVMDEAPASTEFSTSSFTMERGLSTTSPAAILSDMSFARALMMPLIFSSSQSPAVLQVWQLPWTG